MTVELSPAPAVPDPKGLVRGFRVKVKEEKTAEAIASITRLLADKSARLIKLGTGRSRGYTHVYFFVASGEEVGLDEIRSIGGVEEAAEIERLMGGVLADRSFFPYTFDGLRLVFFSWLDLGGILTGMKNNFGEDATSVLFYHSGREAGEKYYESILAEILESLGPVSLADLARFIEAQILAWGWARVEIAGISEREAVLKLWDYWECSFGKPRINYLRGLLEALSGKALRRSVRCEDRVCGGEPSCCELRIVLD